MADTAVAMGKLLYSIVSRTRRSVFLAMRSIVQYAAPAEPGPRHAETSNMGPGSAAQRFALRSAREKSLKCPKSFRTLDDVDVKGKRVLLRVDLNVAHGEWTRHRRHPGSNVFPPPSPRYPTRAAKSYCSRIFGRPKGREPKDSLKPVAAALAQVIKKPVAFADECIR